jgi:hypothetical protein
VVSGIALVAGEVDGAVGRSAVVLIWMTLRIRLIPVVAAPALVGDVLDGEAFLGRQRTRARVRRRQPSIAALKVASGEARRDDIGIPERV